MPSHRALPQELVDQVIDELGGAYRDPDHGEGSDPRIEACEALHACALVSKNWTNRPRVYLFREVNVKGDEDGECPIPPPSLMPYVTNLKMQLHSERYRLFFSRNLLTPFYTAPITQFGIEDGVFATEARVCLVECITALSPTLQTVVFEYCVFSPHLITDIMLAHPSLKHLHLLGCDLKPVESNRSMIHLPDVLSKIPDLELRVSSEPMWEAHGRNIAAVAQLPMQFGRLDFDHISGQRATLATNGLIKASAGSLISLTVRLTASKFWRGDDRPPFSLEDCSNLSELTLDMEHTNSCIVKTSADILSTLGVIQCSRLERIRLTTRCVYQWICTKSRVKLAQAWGILDILLSELAKVTIGRRGKRLAFFLVSSGLHKERCISFGRKWLPKLLPRFHELGSLRVDCERDRLKPPVYGCCCHHGLTCMGEDFDDPSQI